jgi:hypothetical protein
MQHAKFYSFTAHEKQQFTHQAKIPDFTITIFDSCGIDTISKDSFFYHHKRCNSCIPKAMQMMAEIRHNQPFKHSSSKN